MIMEALIEGGWSKDQDEENKDKADEETADTELSSIIKDDEKAMVQSALQS